MSEIWFRKFYDKKGLKKKNRIKILIAFEEESTVKRVLKPERNDVSEALRRSFKRQTSDNDPVSVLLLVIVSVLPKFNFKFLYFLTSACTKIYKNRRVTFVSSKFYL